jgi:hypothetical protein
MRMRRRKTSTGFEESVMANESVYVNESDGITRAVRFPLMNDERPA